MTDLICDGPRGRRLVLELARAADPEIGRVIWDLSYNAAVGAGAAIVRFGVDEDGVAFSDATGQPVEVSHSPSDAAALIRALDRLHPTSDQLAEAFRRSVDAAAYWQPPDGDDLVAAQPEVHRALSEVGAGLAERADAAWWRRERAVEQWAIEFDPSGHGAPFDPAPDAARRWTASTLEEDERAARERPADVTARFGGHWWSHPWGAPHTTGSRPDGVPAGIPYVEDGFGWTRAVAIPVRGAGATLEIRSADDWAELCRRYPLEVTASRRHEWYQTTGRDGRWLLPDWGRVAGDWACVHLSAWAYLTAATRAIDVDDEYASIIAGWGPDETYWLDGLVREVEGPRELWVADDSEGPWRRA